jgi:hypothetical protein
MGTRGITFLPARMVLEVPAVLVVLVVLVLAAPVVLVALVLAAPKPRAIGVATQSLWCTIPGVLLMAILALSSRFLNLSLNHATSLVLILVLTPDRSPNLLLRRSPDLIIPQSRTTLILTNPTLLRPSLPRSLAARTRTSTTSGPSLRSSSTDLAAAFPAMATSRSSLLRGLSGRPTRSMTRETRSISSTTSTVRGALASTMAARVNGLDRAARLFMPATGRSLAVPVVMR